MPQRIPRQERISSDSEFIFLKLFTTGSLSLIHIYSTYRVYDYGRVGADGKPRQLHVEKALDVTRLAPVERVPGPASVPLSLIHI